MKPEFLNRLEAYVKKSLKNDKSGHDYTHTKRVLKNMFMIVENSLEADKDVLIISCWLHDIAYKDGVIKDHHLVGAREAEEFLKKIGYPEEKIKKVKIIIEDHVRKTTKPLRSDSELCIESKILLDADHLDALGKIGIKRASKFNREAKRPEIISKEDKFNDSLYGSLKQITLWAENTFTLEGARIAKLRVKPIRPYLTKLEKKFQARLTS